MTETQEQTKINQIVGEIHKTIPFVFFKEKWREFCDLVEKNAEQLAK